MRKFWNGMRAFGRALLKPIQWAAAIIVITIAAILVLSLITALLALIIIVNTYRFFKRFWFITIPMTWLFLGFWKAVELFSIYIGVALLRVFIHWLQSRQEK